LIEAGSCPTIGCGKLVEPMEKCWNCEGLGRELIRDMCRSHWYDCNRCGGTGYQKKKPVTKGPTILLTPMGFALAEALEEEEKKLPWYGQRFEAATSEDDCHWCGLPEDHHAGTKHKCPMNAAALLESVQYARDQERMRRETEAYQEAHRRDGIKTIIFCVVVMLLALSPCVLAAILGR